MVELHGFLVPEMNELAKAEGFEDFTMDVSQAANVGDGFMGLLLRVVIEGSRLIDGVLVENSKFKVVIKMPPDSVERREQFKAIPIFEREALFYSKYYPMLVQFQHDRGITEEADGFFAVPKCYKVISDAENGNYAMIMEDLRDTGYQMFNKHKVIDLQHVTLLLKNLARMHALSFVMRDQQPEMFNEIRILKDIMSEQMIENSESFPMMMNTMVDKAITALGPLEEFKVEKMEKLKGEAIKTFEFCASHANAEPFGVLMHGDCWNNNMMYAYDEVIIAGHSNLICRSIRIINVSFFIGR
jgi:Ecdysteroid kinase-like family